MVTLLLGGCAFGSGAQLETRSGSISREAASVEPGAVGRGRPGGGERRGDGRGDGDGRDGREGEEGLPIVEILKASPSQLDETTTYNGTTQPRRQVRLRAQVTAQLLSLSVEVGESVGQGQVLAQLDATLLRGELREAEAELAVRQAELAQAETKLAEIQTTVNQAKAELQQARLDGDRLLGLARQGAIAQQQADLAQTERRVAEQRVRATEEQARTQTQAIAAARQRITAQQAVVQQVQQQLSFSQIMAPLTGVVLAKVAEPGDLIQAGQEILTLGDLRETQVVMELTDQERSQVGLGQRVRVQLDAFPDRSFEGTVSQISPVADPVSRLIPVEIALATSEPLGSGLLARVNLQPAVAAAVVVPQTAVVQGTEGTAGSVFVVQQDGLQGGVASDPLGVKVKAQAVKLGGMRNGQVEVVSGLNPGQLYVAKSDRPLQSGQVVQRSLVSEF